MPITLGDTSITGITGNQGIGTDAPSYQLDVSKSVNSDFVARIRNTSGSTSSDNALLVETNTASGARIISARNAGAERFSVSGSGDVDVYNTFKFNSGYGSSATAFGCRSWVNFNGTGTVSIRASGNVSSITDNGTGDYTVNFTTAMPDGNYSINGSAGRGASGSDARFLGPNYTNPATTNMRFTVFTPTGPNDVEYVSIGIFR